MRRALYTVKLSPTRRVSLNCALRPGKEYNWDLNYGEIANLPRGLHHSRAVPAEITDAYAENKGIAEPAAGSVLQNIADEYQQALRDVVAYAVQNGIPVPTFSAAVAYYDSYRSAVLPANLIGRSVTTLARTRIKRTDKEGVFHTEWFPRVTVFINSQ